jgi:hypothetical protein
MDNMYVELESAKSDFQQSVLGIILVTSERLTEYLDAAGGGGGDDSSG